MASMQFDAEAQYDTLLAENGEVQARDLCHTENDEVLPAAPAPAAGRPSKRLVAGLLLAGAGACATALAGAGRWSRLAGAPTPSAPGVEGLLIQDDAWASCDTDWVIKKRVFDNLGEVTDKGFPDGLRYEVERHGGGLPAQRFLLDVKAPEIKDGDRLGHGKATGSLEKLHLAHGHPMNLHFSLWDMEHKNKLTMENFGIGFYDIDESKKGGHHEFIVAEPSMVARVGPALKMETLESGKMKFQGTKFGLGEDDPESNTELTDEQAQKYVRLIYSNVEEFVVSFGWTNPSHGIPREISFSLHDPAHCEDPREAPAHPDEDMASSSAIAEAQAAEDARREAEKDAKKAEKQAAKAKKAEEKAEKKAAAAKHRAAHLEALKHKAEHAAEVAEKKADHHADLAKEKAEHAEALQEKAEDALEDAKEAAENKVDGAEDKLDAAKEKLDDAKSDAKAAQRNAKEAEAAQDDAEADAKRAHAEMIAAKKEERDAKSDASRAHLEMVNAKKAEHRAEHQAAAAEKASEAAQDHAEVAEKKEDCAEGKAKADEELRKEEHEQLENMEDKIDDIMDATPAPCTDCDK